MKEELTLIHYGYWSDDKKPDLTVSVEYRPRRHWSSDERADKAYDVLVDGEVIGQVEQAVENTDRIYGRIRSPGKGRIAWAWQRPRTKDEPGHEPIYNRPGVYARTRRHAVAAIFGYDDVRKP